MQFNITSLSFATATLWDFFKTLLSLSDIHNIENSRRKWMIMKNKHFFVSHLNNLKMLNDPGAQMLCCSSSSFGPYAWLGYKGIAREFLKTCFEGKWKGVFGYCEHWRDRCKSWILDRGMFCDRQRQPDCHPLPEGFLPNKNASAKNLTKHSCHCVLTLKKGGNLCPLYQSKHVSVYPRLSTLY